MIKVVYDGNLGNNLFQYAFARLLAEKHELSLEVAPIKGFPNTYEPIRGRIIISDEPCILRGQRPTIPDEVNLQILITGYFQRIEYYLPHREKIRHWFKQDYQLYDAEPDQGDVVVGIRRGNDYIPAHGLPSSYYDHAIEIADAGKVYICTDSPNDRFVRTLAKRHGAKVRRPGAQDNLAFIRRFKKIVVSNSTFVWWGAFLSHASLVVMPHPSNGFWSHERISKDISLIDGFPNSVVLSCPPYKSEFWSESMATVSTMYWRRTKRLIRSFTGISPKQVEAQYMFLDAEK